MPANRTLTPGAYDALATAVDACVKGYATRRRPTVWQALKLKRQALQRYGLSPLNPLNWSGYTLDHLVPLELGGLPLSLLNVWPQLKADAKRKDAEENHLRRLVCTGTITLAAAQQAMIADWSV